MAYAAWQEMKNFGKLYKRNIIIEIYKFMQLIPQQPTDVSALKFKLRGFPEDAAIKYSLEQFYRGQTGQPRNFLIYNMFDELIFTGSVDEHGRLGVFAPQDRREDKNKLKPE